MANGGARYEKEGGGGQMGQQAGRGPSINDVHTDKEREVAQEAYDGSDA